MFALGLHLLSNKLIRPVPRLLVTSKQRNKLFNTFQVPFLKQGTCLILSEHGFQKQMLQDHSD